MVRKEENNNLLCACIRRAASLHDIRTIDLISKKIKVKYKKTDRNTFNFKKGKRLIILGTKK